jgi:short-subunit dehydrogenase
MAHGMQLRGARTLITGASGGIGAALARRFAREGAVLVLTGRRKDVLDALAAELGATAIVADLADPAEVVRLLADIGRIDILLSNAALPGSGRLAVLDTADVDRAVAVNLRAPIALAHALAPQMAERGCGGLIFIGSLGATAATAGSSVYNATKFGLRGFALALRSELAGSGVGVSLVHPGFVKEAGMFADSRVVLPRWVGTSALDHVTDAVVRAARENPAELTVAPLSMRLGALITSVAPEIAARGARKLGGEAIARRFEEAQAEKR